MIIIKRCRYYSKMILSAADRILLTRKEMNVGLTQL